MIVCVYASERVFVHARSYVLVCGVCHRKRMFGYGKRSVYASVGNNTAKQWYFTLLKANMLLERIQMRLMWPRRLHDIWEEVKHFLKTHKRIILFLGETPYIDMVYQYAGHQQRDLIYRWVNYKHCYCLKDSHKMFVDLKWRYVAGVYSVWLIIS